MDRTLLVSIPTTFSKNVHHFTVVHFPPCIRQSFLKYEWHLIWFIGDKFLKILYALLSLLASDTVERKLGSESRCFTTYYHDIGLLTLRMLPLWLGANVLHMVYVWDDWCPSLLLEVYGNSERAGVTLAGVETYTAHRTESSLCYWRIINRTDSPVSWCDLRLDSMHELLSLMQSSSFAWIRPVFIAIGYTRSWHSRRRCIMEIIIPFLWGVFPLAIFIST